MLKFLVLAEETVISVDGVDNTVDVSHTSVELTQRKYLILLFLSSF